jgi:hypothetical protein
MTDAMGVDGWLIEIGWRGWLLLWPISDFIGRQMFEMAVMTQSGSLFGNLAIWSKSNSMLG